MWQYLPFLFAQKNRLKASSDEADAFDFRATTAGKKYYIKHETPATIRTFAEPSRQWFPACKLTELPRQKSHTAWVEFIVFILC